VNRTNCLEKGGEYVRELKREFIVAITTGGTYTDVLSSDNTGMLRSAKSATTPLDSSTGIMNALRILAEKEHGLSLDGFLGATKTVVLGTAIATNAILNGIGAKAAMINTQGFTDILEQRRIPKGSSYWKVPKPVILIPRYMRYGVEERVKYTGEIITPLNEDSAREAVRRAKANKAEAIAVCLMHSYIQPKHERRLAEIVKEEYPEADVVLSSDVLPRVGEYDRFATTAVTAYIAPVVAQSLKDIRNSLEGNGFKGVLLVMTGAGGAETSEVAVKRPSTTIGSNESGNALSAIFLAELADVQDVLLVDMGGTRTSACILPKRIIPLNTRNTIGDQLSGTEMVSFNTFGAGGGSIAWLEQGRKVRFGLDGAGTNPGPACYGKGRTKPTVTDADLLLGYISPDQPLWEENKPDISAARRAIENEIAQPLGIDAIEAAYLIRLAADLTLADQAFVRCIDYGCDPSGMVLFAAGGHGPVHGFDLARHLKIRRIFVPKFAPVFCNLGMLNCDYRHEFFQALYRESKDLDINQVRQAYERMETEGCRTLELEGVPRENIEIIRGADICYYGQATDIGVALPGAPPDTPFTTENLRTLINDFHRSHAETRGYSDEKAPTVIRNLKLIAFGKREKVNLPEMPASGQDPSRALRRHRDVFFKESGGFVSSPCYQGDQLGSGNVVRGPALIEEKATTLVIPPGAQIEVDKYGNYVGSLIGVNE
jgi:N-methylhydantoinase A